MRLRITFLAAGFGLATLIGFGEGIRDLLAHQYPALGYLRNSFAVLRAKLDERLLLLMAVMVALVLLEALLRRLVCRSRNNSLPLAVATMAAASVWVYQGYPKNRYRFHIQWKETVEFLGVPVPQALFIKEIWAANLLITLECALIGILLYFVMRALFRGRAGRLGAAFIQKSYKAFLAMGLLLLLGTHAMAFALLGREGEGPNVILISLDTLRADYLGCYGDGRTVSPAIDRLAERSILFERAYSQAPNTLPSHKSLLTSRFPSVNRGAANVDKLPPWSTLAPEIFREAGYRTCGIVDGFFLTDRFGMEQGYDDFVGWGRRAQNIVPRAIRWLDRHGDQPFFLFIHIYDIHTPYARIPRYKEMFQPAPYEGTVTSNSGRLAGYNKRKVLGRELPYTIDDEDARYLMALYAGGIRYTDDVLAGLFDHLSREGFYENTIVVLVADHGEEFMEHGSVGHTELYGTVTRVPLILHLPGGKEGGARISHAVGLIDVLPTLLDLTGLEPPGPVSGRSLMPFVTGEAGRTQRYVFSETEVYGGRRSVVGDRYHLVRNLPADRWELFDYRSDPLEQINIIDSLPEVADSLKKFLVLLEQGLDREIAIDAGQAADDVKLDDRTREALRTFGYLD